MRQRTIVCPIIHNDGAILLCKMASDRGVFPASGRCPAAEWSQAKPWNKRCAVKSAKN